MRREAVSIDVDLSRSCPKPETCKRFKSGCQLLSALKQTRKGPTSHTGSEEEYLQVLLDSNYQGCTENYSSVRSRLMEIQKSKPLINFVH